ncbi:glutathione S-transferase [Novosphingobium sp. G106]|uniref:glutathione S-transferase n=1 Tax=Novosphingobium sp. G106 TaxID=2849500 RepID=UPI001C2D841D|nr:glutathione S-transferase [Novosphingobium sp. G106]MBV1688093.1 glutathione S-transferase [Novosphingobium sp. G106]
MEAADIPYRDRAREEGNNALSRHLEGMKQPAFAVPLLEGHGVTVAQTANILLYLGEKHALAPQSLSGRLWVHQLQLTIADVVTEAHNVHHPIGASLYYEDQKDVAKQAAKGFREERIPAFLDYFERSAGNSGWLVGDAWTYADTSLFQLVEGLRYAFPERMKALAKDYPKVAALAERVAEMPQLTDYLASERRLAFNEQGIFRHYPELDGP